MRKFAVSTGALALMAMVASGAAGQDEACKLPEPTKEHRWLQQLVGQWDAEVEMCCGPDQPAVKSKATESVRAIGGFWVLSENDGQTPMGPFKGVMTLGYDVKKAKYVGTWVDSMTGHLWQYEGAVDAAARVLTLNAEGPCPTGADKTVKFRETLEIKSADEKVFKSAIEMDGKWTTCFTAVYKRKVTRP